jgi:hypothetical protein
MVFSTKYLTTFNNLREETFLKWWCMACTLSSSGYITNSFSLFQTLSFVALCHGVSCSIGMQLRINKRERERSRCGPNLTGISQISSLHRNSFLWNGTYNEKRSKIIIFRRGILVSFFDFHWILFPTGSDAEQFWNGLIRKTKITYWKKHDLCYYTHAQPITHMIFHTYQDFNHPQFKLQWIFCHDAFFIKYLSDWNHFECFWILL